jgi:hypothetical protein
VGSNPTLSAIQSLTRNYAILWSLTYLCHYFCAICEGLTACLPRASACISARNVAPAGGATSASEKAGASKPATPDIFLHQPIY